ncbi:hypothetical protein [Alkalicoccus chagannorensis]|uniref:hypothetical protein n=1 Tax=Alkalicoccus chagannorensis TaxID=427072 RepID=UPI0003F992A3|nr:hypothetical protein [Alkalicoccus chagannorensis]
MKKKKNIYSSIDFEAAKQEKERQELEAAQSFLSMIRQEALSGVNLREKVRAKHLFQDLTGMDVDQGTDAVYEHFLYWLMLDYVTVVGSRPLDLFVRREQHAMTSAELGAAGLFMLMRLEPYFVTESHNGVCYAQCWEDSRKYKLSGLKKPLTASENSWILCRTTIIGTERRAAGPMIQLAEAEEKRFLETLENQWNMGEKSYQRYMKEAGVAFLTMSQVDRP